MASGAGWIGEYNVNKLDPKFAEKQINRAINGLRPSGYSLPEFVLPQSGFTEWLSVFQGYIGGIGSGIYGLNFANSCASGECSTGLRTVYSW